MPIGVRLARGPERSVSRLSSFTYSAGSPGYQYWTWQLSQASSRFSPASHNFAASFCFTISSTSMPTFLSAWTFAFHSTGSFSSLAVICAGDNSDASGPVLLFSSPAGANGRGIFRSCAASASATPPIWTLSQSSCVLGWISWVPAAVTTILTDSKTLSAIGSIMCFINSLTVTTGSRVPQRGFVEPAGADADDEAGVEHEVSSAATNTTTDAARILPVDTYDILNSRHRQEGGALLVKVITIRGCQMRSVDDGAPVPAP